jgi:hypothetical protein
LKLLDLSADRSTSVRESTCNGIFRGKESRAWRAASLADFRAASGGGEGNSVGIGRAPSSESSFVEASIAADVDCARVLAIFD